MKNVEIIKNMSFSEYLSLPRLSSSKLKDFAKSPAYMKWREENPMKETEAMKIGTMIHTWILENHKFQHEYYLTEKYDRRTKDGKAAYNAAIEAAGDRVVIEKSVFDKFKHLQPYNDTQNELTILFEHQGVECKARVDAMHVNGMEDIKSTADIFKCVKQFFNLNYHIQAGFYQIAYKAAYDRWPEFFKFTFISTNDFVVKHTFDLEFDLMEISRDMAARYIGEYKECEDKGTWDLGLGDYIETPSWL